MKSILTLILVTCWVAGAVLAKGAWSTFFAFIFPFWAWYLVVEKCLISFGWI